MENKLSIEPGKYERRVQRVIGTDRFWSAGDKQNRFVRMLGGVAERSGL